MEFPSKLMQELRDDYWMVKRLGSGGFGKVYLVRHRRTKVYSAAKHQKITSKAILTLSRREADILRRLEHSDHIVRFVDYFESEQQSVIATEFLAGGELFEGISSKEFQLTEAKCRDFTRQMLLGLEFLHQRKILHLDMKPQNIMFVNHDRGGEQCKSSGVAVGGGGAGHGSAASAPPSPAPPAETTAAARLKIIDFGLARELPQQTDRISANMCGTLEFMSPEVMRCTFATTASDLWGLGVVLFMMVSGGVSPFWAGNDLNTQHRVVRAQYRLDYPAFANVSRHVLDLITR